MLTTEALKASSYEGWVAWVDNSPIFEEVRSLPKLAQVMAGGSQPSYRRGSHNTMDWTQLPFERVQMVQLYFDRALGRKQPVIEMAREPNADVRFFQFKRGGVVVNAGMNAPAGHGQHRTGVQSYVMGYYDRARKFAQMWEVRRGVLQQKEHPIVGHPCWPRPHGYGLNPRVMGLKESDVPPLPTERGDDGQGLISVG